MLLQRLLGAQRGQEASASAGSSRHRCAQITSAISTHRVRVTASEHLLLLWLLLVVVLRGASDGGLLRLLLLRLVLVANLAAVVHTIHSGVLQLRAGVISSSQTVHLVVVHEVHKPVAFGAVECLK